MNLDKMFIAKNLAINDDSALTFEPSREHLELINQFTLSPVTAKDVIVLPIKAMNDSVDRDYEMFDTDIIESLANNKGETGPLGKSFILSHDHTSLANGRIYAAEKEEEEGVSHLKLHVYIPKTEQHKDFIENIMFGVYWAVSVGIGVKNSVCSVCGSAWKSSFFFDSSCPEGHVKGEKYDGKLCYKKYLGVEEFYELSQVYLGAQYGAQIAKKMVDGQMSVREAIKSASPANAPIPDSAKLLSDKAKTKLAWPELLELCMESLRDGEAPEELEQMCQDIGKNAPWKFSKIVKLIEEGAQLESIGGEMEIIKGAKKWVYDGNRIIRKEVKQVENDVKELQKEIEIKTSEAEAFEAKCESLDKIIEDTKAELDSIKEELSKTKSELEIKAEIAKSYIQSLKDDVIKWFKLSKGTQDVDTSMVVKLVDKCDNDPELLKELGSDFEARAKEAMPLEVRRSSMEDTSFVENKTSASIDDNGIVSSIHG